MLGLPLTIFGRCSELFILVNKKKYMSSRYVLEKRYGMCAPDITVPDRLPTLVQSEVDPAAGITLRVSSCFTSNI